MQTGDKGLAIIKYFEGFHSEPYLDPIGIPTIGYGTVYLPNGSRVTMDMDPITRREGHEFLAYSLRQIENNIATTLTYGDDLNQNQFDALASFIYNVGIGNFKASTMRRKLNRGDFEGAAGEFWKWRRAGGIIFKGLVRRREMEEELFRLPIAA